MKDLSKLPPEDLMFLKLFQDFHLKKFDIGMECPGPELGVMGMHLILEGKPEKVLAEFRELCRIRTELQAKQEQMLEKKRGVSS